MGRKQTLNLKRKDTSNLQRTKASLKTAALREAFQEYRDNTGKCFNKCRATRNSGPLEYQVSHYKPRCETGAKKPYDLICYHQPSTRAKKIKELKVQFRMCGILCKKCHHSFDNGVVAWADDYKKNGSKVWEKYIEKYEALSKDLENA